MRIDNQKILKAQQALIESEIVTEGKYKKEFNGYISSLGAAIVQSGLLPAMVFLEGNSEQAPDRIKVARALTIMLSDKFDIGNSIAQYLISQHDNSDFDENYFLKEITDDAVALKLTLRMYQKTDTQKGGVNE